MHGMTATTLNQLPLLQRAIIQAINAPDALKATLLSLGIMEGLEVLVRHRGPFGGSPLAIDFGGHMLALRIGDAARISVTPLQG
jgi:Fe2+ transport system protein FeoA